MDEQMQQQIVQLVQMAMQGDQQAQQQVQQIMQAAQQGDPQAQQIAQVIQAVVQQMQGQQTQAMRRGGMLNYLKFLRGQCPEGYEMQYFENGGKAGCKKCQKAKEGEKMDPVTAYKCGRKMKKKEQGGNIDSAKCGKKIIKDQKPATPLKKQTPKQAPKQTSKQNSSKSKWIESNTDEGTEYTNGKGRYITHTPGIGYQEKGKTLSNEEAQKLGLPKKANGGNIDIFAPYRNLQIKKKELIDFNKNGNILKYREGGFWNNLKAFGTSLIGGDDTINSYSDDPYTFTKDGINKYKYDPEKKVWTITRGLIPTIDVKYVKGGINPHQIAGKTVGYPVNSTFESYNDGTREFRNDGTVWVNGKQIK